MIVGLYIIGTAIAILVLVARLHEARDELARVRRERDTYARAVESSLLAPLTGARRRRRSGQLSAMAASPEQQMAPLDRWAAE
jgi:hypothetical protein